MDTAIKKGSICKIDATIDVSGLSKVWRKTYGRMIRMNADYYIVLRSADNDEVLCVPLLREKNRHSVRLVINSTSYYADYLVFLSAPATWFVCEKVRVSNTLDSVHKIYEARKAHNLNVLERKRKKEQQKREDKRCTDR